MWDDDTWGDRKTCHVLILNKCAVDDVGETIRHVHVPSAVRENSAEDLRGENNALLQVRLGF